MLTNQVHHYISLKGHTSHLLIRYSRLNTAVLHVAESSYTNDTNRLLTSPTRNRIEETRNT